MRSLPRIGAVLLATGLAGALVTSACTSFEEAPDEAGGEDGSVSAPGDTGAGPDADASADSAVLPFSCESDPTLLFCDDFDTPPLSGQWTPWDSPYTNPSGVALPSYDQTIAFSFPNSLHVDTGRSGANRASYLVKPLSLIHGWTTLKLSMHLHLSSFLPANGDSSTTVNLLYFRLLHSGPNKRVLYYRFRSDNASVAFGQLQGLGAEDAYLNPADFTAGAPMDEWFELTTTIHNDGDSIWVEVTQNGAPVIGRYDMAITPPISSVIFYLGSEIEKDGAGADIHYDDVRVGP